MKLSKRELVQRLTGVRLLTLDVDGVLTDGGLYYADDGSQLRKFNVKDGMGIKRAQSAGVTVAIVTASRTPSILHRAKSLGIEHVRLGIEDKASAVEDLCRECLVMASDVAHMGDDLNDLPVFRMVGLALTVTDAVAPVREAADYVTVLGGGQGAVREICDLIVGARESVAGGVVD
jgi:3-deoxy-D-manno-octulosonate 8-phosphate phosphatase (KDO 8-P phosphatase)